MSQGPDDFEGAPAVATLGSASTSLSGGSAEAGRPKPPPPAPRRRLRYRILGAVMVVLVVGNLGLLALTGLARATVDVPPAPDVPGVGSLRVVDDKLLRGAHPSREGYLGLRDLGVTTIVDLRAEPDADEHDSFLRELGMEVVHLPIRDGQTPSEEQQAALPDIIERSDGLVFIHCGAGVGRTGVMVARYLVETGQSSRLQALAWNLEVGPPSIEQNAYTLGIDLGILHPSLVGVSRFFDAPRRILHYL